MILAVRGMTISSTPRTAASGHGDAERQVAVRAEVTDLYLVAVLQ
jgi:hypothetical protein